jgi:plastocyanin
MQQRPILILAALVITAAIASSAARATTTRTRLVGTVGPGLDIVLRSSSGRVVTMLRHGTYIVVVHDRSRIHDFHLSGPGVNKVVTNVGFVGTKTIRLTLKPGRYRYVCDPHAFVMHGAFRVS